MTSTMLRCCLLLLGVACYASCYRSHVGGGGSYTLPQIGKYPAPTPTFPGRNQGLPPVYHGKFKRSIAVPEDAGMVEVEDPAQYHIFKRSVDGELEQEFDGIVAFDEPQTYETSRSRRHADGYRLILPTYRPPRKQRPRILYA